MVIFRPPHLHSKLEPNKVDFTGVTERFYMEKFIAASVHGLAGHMTPDNQDQFKKPVCVVYYNVDYKRNPKGEIFRSLDPKDFNTTDIVFHSLMNALYPINAPLK